LPLRIPRSATLKRDHEIMNTQTTPASAAAAGGKKTGISKSVAKGAPKPKRYVVLGADGVAALDKLCAALEKSIGFRPTQAQVALRLIAQAQEKAEATAATAQAPAGEATAASAS
jgi:hypothetical protein